MTERMNNHKRRLSNLNHVHHVLFSFCLKYQALDLLAGDKPTTVPRSTDHRAPILKKVLAKILCGLAQSLEFELSNPGQQVGCSSVKTPELRGAVNQGPCSRHHSVTLDLTAQGKDCKNRAPPWKASHTIHI